MKKEEAFLNPEYIRKVWVIKSDWSSEEEVGKSLSLRSKCSLGIHLCNPFCHFKFVPFQLIQINTNLCIFLICLFMSFIHIMHDQNDYCFSKMINKKYKRYCITQSFGIMRYFNQKWSKFVNEIRRIAHVLAWMLRDKNTWSRNSKNHHSAVFLLSSGIRLVQSLHHNTSHFIT